MEQKENERKVEGGGVGEGEGSAAKWGGRDELSRADTLGRVGVN